MTIEDPLQVQLRHLAELELADGGDDLTIQDAAVHLFAFGRDLPGLDILAVPDLRPVADGFRGVHAPGLELLQAAELFCHGFLLGSAANLINLPIKRKILPDVIIIGFFLRHGFRSYANPR